MILRLLKNHPITARNLRRENPTKNDRTPVTPKSTLAALIAAGIVLATASPGAMAQDRLKAASVASDTINFSDLDPETASKIKAEHYSVQGHNIQQTYHQQLIENRQRTALSSHHAAYGQPLPQQSQRPQYLASPNGVAPATPIADFPRSTPSTAMAVPASTAAPASTGGFPSAQTYMPPVHIMPPQHPYYAGMAGPRMAENRHGVQNFAPQTAQHRTANTTAYRQPVPVAAPAGNRNNDFAQQRLAEQSDATNNRSAANVQDQKQSHVFLQDRIANALTRRFKRGEAASATPAVTSNVTQSSAAQTSASQEIAHSVMEFESDSATEPQVQSAPESGRSFGIRRSKSKSDIVFNNHAPTPLQTSINDIADPVGESFEDEYSYSEILESNQYASQVGGIDAPEDRPSDHQMDRRSNPRDRHANDRRPAVKRAIHHDHQDETFEVFLGEEDATLFDRYQTIRQTSAQHSHHDHRSDHAVAEPRSPRRIKRTTPSRKPRRTRTAALPRPDQLDSTGRRITGKKVSVFLPQDDNDFSPTREDDDFSPRDDFEIDRQRNRDIDIQDRPDRRDDLQDADEEFDRNNRRRRDRVRSRLDDELDLEDLDNDLDDDLDQDDLDDDRPVRAPRKSCREYQNELIAGSIRDISLDISPPAASEGAQYGGLARTWTDRRGNILATGALVDLRRGYVILDSGQKLAYARLSESDLAAVSEFWRLPEVCVIGNTGGSPYRSWTPQVVTWKASNLCHKPLFFENIQLERYGHSRGPIAQPIHSTLHFFVSLVSVPYNTAISPPTECEYALGYYRPGNCAPWLKDPVPISLEGIRREALFVTGAAFIP